jgi:hypothetical protein
MSTSWSTFPIGVNLYPTIQSLSMDSIYSSIDIIGIHHHMGHINITSLLHMQLDITQLKVFLLRNYKPNYSYVQGVFLENIFFHLCFKHQPQQPTSLILYIWMSMDVYPTPL